MRDGCKGKSHIGVPVPCRALQRTERKRRAVLCRSQSPRSERRGFHHGSPLHAWPEDVVPGAETRGWYLVPSPMRGSAPRLTCVPGQPVGAKGPMPPEHVGTMPWKLCPPFLGDSFGRVSSPRRRCLSPGAFWRKSLAVCIWTFKVSTRFPTPPGAS